MSRGADEERGAGGDDEDQRELQVRSNGEDGGHVGWRGPCYRVRLRAYDAAHRVEGGGVGVDRVLLGRAGWCACEGRVGGMRRQHNSEVARRTG